MPSSTVEDFATKLFDKVTEAGFTLKEAEEINKILCSKISDIGMAGMEERYSKPISDLVGLVPLP